MEAQIRELNDADFSSVAGCGIALVDFWAPWCGPCRMQTPILNEIAAEMKGLVTVAKVNVDEHQSNAVRLGVQGVPTMLLFKDGKAIGRFVGLQRKETLLSAIRAACVKAA